MNIVFLSGSRSISRLHPDVQQRLDNIIASELDVVVGDANGADKAMQKYLAAHGYSRVTVFYVGLSARNNAGSWKEQRVEASSSLTGWEYYAQKDKRMAELTDYGLVLWDGESAGSIHNVFELLKNHKKVVAFYNPQKRFINVSSEEEALELLNTATSEIVNTVSKKIKLTKYISALQKNNQAIFGF